jgi:hypothetical protein
MAGSRTLLSLNHDELKDSIVRLLKHRVKEGGRGSIKRSVLQQRLTKFLSLDAVLGNARKKVDASLNRAIAALRLEKAPRLDKDRGDDMVRLAKK